MTCQVIFEDGIKETYLILSHFFIVQDLLKTWVKDFEAGPRRLDSVCDHSHLQLEHKVRDLKIPFVSQTNLPGPPWATKTISEGSHLASPLCSQCLLWQSPRGKRAVPHWASMLRWIWSISEYNLLRNPDGVLTRSMDFVRWYSPSQAYSAKHVSYPQLTATPTPFQRLSGLLPGAYYSTSQNKCLTTCSDFIFISHNVSISSNAFIP